MKKLTQKKLYVAPHVQLFEMAPCLLLETSSEVSSSPTVGSFGDGGKLNGGELEQNTARRSSLWD